MTTRTSLSAYAAEFPYRAFAALEPIAARDTLAVRPAFRWVADIYRRHRGTSMEIAG
jgi:hypothetical protein